MTNGARILPCLRPGSSHPTWVIAGLLAVSELIYIKLVRFEAVSSTRSVATFLALIAILFLLYGASYFAFRNHPAPHRKALVIIITGAIVFRATLLFAGLPPDATRDEATSRLRADIRSEAVTYDSYLLFDNDIWRYLWDGHVSAHGLNPYRFEPHNPELDQLAESTQDSTLWADIRANVNHPDVPTIYAPLAQLVFRTAHAIAPGSVFIMKLLVVACDLLTILIIVFTLRALNRPLTDVVLYAWNPLILKTVAGSGHVDAALGMLLAATVYFVVRGQRTFAGMAWGLSVLVKISPIILLPFLIRRLGWKRFAIGIAVVIIGYAPYFDTSTNPFSGLLQFAGEWQFNSGLFSLVESLASPFSSNPVALAKLTSTSIYIAVMIWLVRLDKGDDNNFPYCCVTALGALLILSPTVMPWYLVWIIPVAVLARTFSWILFSLPVCLSFLVMIDGRERPWALLVEYGILALLLTRELASAKRLRRSQTLGSSFSSDVLTGPFRSSYREESHDSL